jgi:hypothetical protein
MYKQQNIIIEFNLKQISMTMLKVRAFVISHIQFKLYYYYHYHNIYYYHITICR